nr:uncharacterized protein LOC111502580 [Leptinotarsa decemlineata]
MAGQYNGLQAKLEEHCTCALFVLCLAHSLNLVVGQAAGCIIEATSYFQLLQKLYSFFASSTHRWNVLKKSLGEGTVVKRLSDTRCSARTDAVSALHKCYPAIIDALRTMDDERETLETRNGARGILAILETLDSVLLTEMWSNILVRCNETSKSLQSESLPLDVALKLVESLLAFVEDQQDMFETCII